MMRDHMLGFPALALVDERADSRAPLRYPLGFPQRSYDELRARSERTRAMLRERIAFETGDWAPKVVIGVGISAPAVQPEAVAELVKALGELLATVDSPFPPLEEGRLEQEMWADRRTKARKRARTLIAKHGQPQGGSNA